VKLKRAFKRNIFGKIKLLVKLLKNQEPLSATILIIQSFCEKKSQQINNIRSTDVDNALQIIEIKRLSLKTSQK